MLAAAIGHNHSSAFLLMFYLRPSDFYNLFKDIHVTGCTNHEIYIVGLCSDFDIRLSYNICLQQKYDPLWGGSNPGPSGRESSVISARPRNYPFSTVDLQFLHSNQG